MHHATLLLYHVHAVASHNKWITSCEMSGKLTLWTSLLEFILTLYFVLYNWHLLIMTFNYNLLLEWFFYRARWLRGNARDSHSGGPGFKSRCQPTWLRFFCGFPQSSRQMLGWIFITTIHLTIIHQIHIYHKINSVNLTIEHWLHTTIEIHSLLVYTQRS